MAVLGLDARRLYAEIRDSQKRKRDQVRRGSGGPRDQKLQRIVTRDSNIAERPKIRND